MVRAFDELSLASRLQDLPPEARVTFALASWERLYTATTRSNSATARSGTGRVAPVKIALILDWLPGMRGGERALLAFCELFPDADLFTLVRVPGATDPIIERRRVKTSPIQWLPQERCCRSCSA